ncbi:uncharacterized protein MONOS_3545 [Monocercomonoides exilis]|uniref:uncharacterized protein n=1 Tax=Monocercomonoides exilis TaxID=2049356 RepID=UPI00355A5F1E|nr:hypothetical protein MONOS_3545 [Monocercomonoides exilis]|eukprot:MONOS_3545.1-p1 / transcript=MONOS_3545.1 / gene=MONOS_3545 / organism=Monocercomonoides_exilis_PA203 / gene_product=unspecified product / transcript_product=unspecified product / location=Mono_scaffold00084:50023-50590(-) / protein_length=134 / sequence_SO=supercontig / SO=protein_coding / is_pseudo=false
MSSEHREISESKVKIPSTLDYFVYLKTRIGDIDDERKDWLSLFDEVQIPEELAHRRAARLEKRRLEKQYVQKDFDELQETSGKSEELLRQYAEENARLKAQLAQDEENIKTLSKFSGAVGPDLTFFLDEDRFH